jgi:hypothetical protein
MSPAFFARSQLHSWQAGNQNVSCDLCKGSIA